LKKKINKFLTRKNPTYYVKEPMALLEFLLATLEGQSRTNIKKLLSERQILINGVVNTQFNHPLVKGDKIEVLYTKIRGLKITGLKIVFEDDDIIVVDKESGILSMATDKEREKTAYSIVKTYLKEKNPMNKVFIVHRLDRDTSGVMIFAKTEEMQQKLQSDWSNLVIERKYIAIVEGRVEKSEDTIESYLRENSVFVTVSSKTDEFGGKLAISHYKVIGKSPAFTMLEVKIDTGRKNQIRAHMQDLGHPIIGDTKYGSKKNPLARLGLHAKTITFVHPKTGKTLEFISPVPARFTDMFKKKKDKKN